MRKEYPTCKKNARAEPAEQVDEGQRAEHRRGDERGGESAAAVGARRAEHEGEDDAAESELFKQPDADALDGKQRRAEGVGSARRALDECDEGKVVDGDDEGGQTKEQRAAARGQPDMAHPHLPREHREGHAQHEAHRAHAKHIGVVCLLRKKQLAQPAGGQQHQPRHQQVDDRRARNGLAAHVQHPLFHARPLPPRRSLRAHRRGAFFVF